MHDSTAGRSIVQTVHVTTRPPRTAMVGVSWLARLMCLDVNGRTLLSRRASFEMGMFAYLLLVVSVFDLAGWLAFLNHLLSGTPLRLTGWTLLAGFLAGLVTFAVFMFERGLVVADPDRRGLGSKVGFSLRFFTTLLAAIVVHTPLDQVAFHAPIEQRHAVEQALVAVSQIHAASESDIEKAATVLGSKGQSIDAATHDHSDRVSKAEKIIADLEARRVEFAKQFSQQAGAEERSARAFDLAEKELEAAHSKVAARQKAVGAARARARQVAARDGADAPAVQQAQAKVRIAERALRAAEAVESVVSRRFTEATANQANVPGAKVEAKANLDQLDTRIEVQKQELAKLRLDLDAAREAAEHRADKERADLGRSADERRSRAFVLWMAARSQRESTGESGDGATEPPWGAPDAATRGRILDDLLHGRPPRWDVAHAVAERIAGEWRIVPPGSDEASRDALLADGKRMRWQSYLHLAFCMVLPMLVWASKLSASTDLSQYYSGCRQAEAGNADSIEQTRILETFGDRW